MPAIGFPNVDDVVVPAAGQVSVIAGPLERTDLLGVSFHGGHQVLRDPDVVVEDEATTRAAGHDVLVPGEDAHAGRMAGHGPEPPLLLHVPELDRAIAEADGQVAAVLRELD